MGTNVSCVRALAAFALTLFVQFPAWAQSNPATQKAEMQAAFSAAQKVQTRGPAEVVLADQGKLNLPRGYVFIPAAEGARLLTAMGNRAGEGLLGLVFPQNGDDWLVVLRLTKSGYVKDDDAKHWKVDELLSGIKEGTEQANKDRRARGIPELEVLGWVEPPAYDESSRRLVWALSSKHKGESDTAERGVNYNTYALGRDGYISLNLVTGMSSIKEYKPAAHELLGALEYHQGKRYSDFNSSTDHVAEYGLAALIGGVAAKKLGLFAMIAAFAAKFAKLIGLAIIGAIAAIGKFFKRDKA